MYIAGPRRTLLLDTEPLQRALKQLTPTTEGALFDLRWSARRGTVWSDSAATIFARPGDPIGALLDARGRYVATQVTGAAKPILQTDGNRWWAGGDGTKWMLFDLDTALDASFLIAAARRTSGTGGPYLIGDWAGALNSGNSIGSGAALTVFNIARTAAGTNTVSQGGAVAVGQDAIFEGGYVPGTLTATLNGVQVDSDPVIKGVSNRSIVLMGRDPAGSQQWTGSVYAASIAGIAPTPVQASAFRQWQAHAAGLVL